jgi:hypothetical protein
MASDYAKEMQTGYGAAHDVLMNISAMEQDLNHISQAKGIDRFLGLGTSWEQRLDAARAANTAAQIAGKQLPFDPNMISTVESLNKLGHTLTFQLSKTFMPGQHAANDTIRRVNETVPTPANSIMGMRLLAATVAAQAHYSIDRYDAWHAYSQAPGHYGNFLDADTQFRQQHDPTGYVNKIYSEFGLTHDGQWTKEGVLNAVREGMMPATEGGKIIDDGKLLQR